MTVGSPTGRVEMPELIWDGKYDTAGRRAAPPRITLPFQTVETVNESAQERQRTLDLFAADRPSHWRNRLIWGDKKWSVALGLGLRQGEALGLRWQHVDLDAGTLMVRWQLQRLAWQHGCADPHLCGKGRHGDDCPGAALVTAVRVPSERVAAFGSPS